MPPELAEVLRWLEKVDHEAHPVEVALDLTLPATGTTAYARCKVAAGSFSEIM